jgi:hypothetical protein
VDRSNSGNPFLVSLSPMVQASHSSVPSCAAQATRAKVAERSPAHCTQQETGCERWLTKSRLIALIMK